jgi:choline dehydrogenase-like flavoprotein
VKGGRKTKAADVCIIGAGLAGGLMAYQLARRGIKVVILEAGPHYELRTRLEYADDLITGRIRGPAWAPNVPERDVYSNAGEINYPVNLYRAKGVGGSTLAWGGQTLRFLERDFRMKSLYGIAEDWPISYEELEPFYTKAERALGISGANDNPFSSWRSADYPMPAFPFSAADKLFQEGCKKLGILVHSIPWARNSTRYGNRPACRAYSTCGTYKLCPIRAQYTSEVHIEQALATGNAELIANAAVVRLLTDQRKRITQAVYRNPDRSEAAQSARLFVLAAHTVESARLLLLSESSQFPNGLANGSGMVGKNFMERPAIAVHGWVKQKIAPHRIGFPTAASMQFCDPKNRHERGGIKLEFHNFAGPTPHSIAASSGNWGAALAEEVRRSYGHQIAVEAAIEQLPDLNNTVTLDPHLRDHFGDPAPKITYGFGAYEKATLAEAARLAREILVAVGAEDIEKEESENKRDHGFAGHPMGTCRMGNDPSTSVVDRNLRTHEIHNLFVVGASSFVTASSLQPALTIAALAIRAAEYIASSPAA